MAAEGSEGRRVGSERMREETMGGWGREEESGGEAKRVELRSDCSRKPEARGTRGMEGR